MGDREWGKTSAEQNAMFTDFFSVSGAPGGCQLPLSR